MAINAYVGLQGSGKSFEVVSSVILDAVSQGRRVVTNVAGINEDLIHEYLINKREVAMEKLGTIVHIENDRIMQPEFFPDEEKPELSSVVKGGDLVAIDEAWRFWGTDSGKLSHEHMQFFRMHRHYIHPETSVTCDVVLMTQDITGLHRSVKNVIEFAFKMHKHKSLGFSKLYRVEIYEGWKLNGKTRIANRQKKYDPEIFPLYQSYAGGQGMERTIDSRQNVFANKILWLYLAGTFLAMLIGGTFTWKFFHRSNPADEAKKAEKAASASAKADSQKPVKTAAQSTEMSDVWRIVGEYQAKDNRWIVIANQSGKLRVESPSVFSGVGIAYIGEVDGAKVARWTGGDRPQANPVPK